MVSQVFSTAKAAHSRPTILRPGCESLPRDPLVHKSDRCEQVIPTLTQLADASGTSLHGWLAAVLAALFYRQNYREHFTVDVIYLSKSLQQSQSEHASGSPLMQVVQCQFTADHNTCGHAYARQFAQQLQAGGSEQQSPKIDDVALVLSSEPLSDVERQRLLRALGRNALALVAETMHQTPHLSWLYAGDENTDSVSRLDQRLHILVNQLQNLPEKPLLNQSILPASEIAQLQAFAQGQQQSVDPTPIYQRVEQQAVKRANALAAEFLDEQLTYAELNRKANALAYYLLQLGVTPGDKVVVGVQPCLDILVAIIGLHKIGAVYVPLDPNFPAARIEAILTEVNPSKILLANDTSFIPNVFLPLCLDISAAFEAQIDKENPNISVSAQDISHIYFTSGTTGKPKGVVASHANLVHYINCAIDGYGFNTDDVFIAAARFTFSISMFELLTPLAVGATVKVLPRSDVLNMPRLAKAVSEATVFHLGPSLLKQLLPYIEQHYQTYSAFDGLRHVSSGGDMVPVEVLESLKRIFRQAEVFVIYGSSEISCMGCTFEVPRDRQLTRTKVGKPHQNTRVEILDKQGNPVPIGVAGQLYFAGDGVVTGYLNQPELTVEKFIVRNGTRFYAIGDVGRWDRQGNVELLGRQDFQVQMRGMRIELLEIEQCLKQHPAIGDCVVVAKKMTQNADPSLVAYLVADPAAQLDASVNDYLRQHLPDYMVPSVLVQLDKLPLNHNAKLDRSQLPHPQADNILLSQQFSEAESDVERKLLGMFENLFGISGIGVDHSFFELGGDSLQAVSLLTQIDREFGRFIPIAYLPEHSTARQLARLVSSEKPIAGVGDVVVLKQGGPQPPLFCLYGVLLYRDLACSLDTERMVCGVYLQEEVELMEQGLDSEAMRDFLDVNKIAERYLSTITAFQAQGPYYLAGESFGGIIALEVARKLRARGESVALVAMFDSHAPGFYKSLSPWRRGVLHLKKALRYGRSYLGGDMLSRLKHKCDKAFDSRPGSASTTEGDIRASARAIATGKYRPAVFEEPVVLFKAMERSEFEPPNTDLGWGCYLPKLTVHNVEGDHLSILRREHVHQLARRLEPHL